MPILSVSDRTYKLLLEVQKKMSLEGKWIVEDDVIYELLEKARHYDVIIQENRSLNRKLNKEDKFNKQLTLKLAESKQNTQPLIMPSMQYNQAIIPLTPPLPPRKSRLFLSKKVKDDDNSPNANKARLKNEVNEIFTGEVKSPAEIMNECKPSHLGAKIMNYDGETPILIISEEEKEKKSNYI